MFSPKAFVLGSVLALAPSLHAADPTWEWVTKLESSDYSSGQAVTVDPSGIVYFSGWANGGKIGSFSIPQYYSHFIATLDQNGTVTRAKSSANSTYVNSKLAMLPNGQALWTGSFNDSLAFPPVSRLGGDYNCFVAAIDSQLNSVWAKPVSFNSAGSMVAVGPSGEIGVTTTFNTADYGGKRLRSVASQDLLVLKTSSDGSLVWMKGAGGNEYDAGSAIDFDADGNLFVGGYCPSSFFSFGPLTIPSVPGNRAVLAKLSADGSPVWAKFFEGEGILAVKALSDKSAVITGMRGSENARQGRIYRLSPTGEIVWSRQIGSLLMESIAVDANDDIYVAGPFFDSITLENKTFFSKGSPGTFVGKFSSAGVLRWGVTAGSAYGVSARQIARGPNGSVFVAGDFTGSARFGSLFVEGDGGSVGYIAKISDPSAVNAPRIATQPNSGAAYFGNSVSFTAAATGAGAISYQWYRDGVAIGGATNATFTIASVRAGDGGHYYVEARNEFGVARSESALLAVRGDSPVWVTTMAGTTTAGFVDSTVPAQVRLSGPNSLAIQGDGTVVFPDSANFAVRMMEPTGAVGTLAGRPPGVAGLSNGPASVALFALPLSVAIDPAWDVFVADAENHMVRKISAFGVRAVSTVAGTGVEGFQNGPGAQAQFAFPNDLVTDGSGNVYVTEFRGHRVRRIAANGTVTTFAGNGTRGHRDGEAQQAMFSDLGGIARDSLGNLYVTEWGNDDIRKITPEGTVSTIAGTPGQRGFVDGPGLTGARLGAPDGIAVDNRGNIFFTEFSNSSVRRIDPSGEVFTLVGSAGQGFRDGDRASAQMNQPGGIAAHPDGSLLVADSYNHAIRRVVWQTNSAPTEATLLVELNPAITIFGMAGRTYRIESSENLIGGPWIVVGEVMLASPVETWFDTQPATRAQRYYRAILK